MTRKLAHLDFIRSLPCMVCGDNTSTEAAHVRMADNLTAKPITGIGIKAPDYWTIPLCGTHHREQHGMNEWEFWRKAGTLPTIVALRLWTVTGDHEAGCKIIEKLRG